MDRPNRTTIPPLRSAVRIKIISVGDPAVGKSCLIKRYCEQRVRARAAMIHNSLCSCHNYRSYRHLTESACLSVACMVQFVSKYVATIGVDYGVKPIKIRGTEVRVNFWDLAGGEEYTEIRNEFYKDAQGVRARAYLRR